MTNAQRCVVYGLSLDGVNFRYVGITSGYLSSRCSAHQWAAANAKKPSKVQGWIRKHRPDAIKVTVLKQCSSMEELLVAEVRWIAFLRGTGSDLLNLTDGGEGVLGMRHTPEMRTAMANRMRGRMVSEETRRKMSVASKAQWVADRAAGKPAPAAGRPKSEEHKAKLRGRTVSEETRRKMSEAAKGRVAPNKGKPMSEEQKAKLRAARLGQKHTEETRAKIGAAQRGKPKSAEHRARIQAAHLARQQPE